MRLFKHFRRSPEERAWQAIWELENALKTQDSAAQQPPEQTDYWDRWRPHLVRACVGLALVFVALMAVNVIMVRLRPLAPSEKMDQDVFDALWGVHRPSDETTTED